jgi:hypothetical protein
MTLEYVELAMKEGYPFEVKMADGRTYQVPDEYLIALLKNTAVIVVEKVVAPYFTFADRYRD